MVATNANSTCGVDIGNLLICEKDFLYIDIFKTTSHSHTYFLLTQYKSGSRQLGHTVISNGLKLSILLLHFSSSIYTQNNS